MSYDNTNRGTLGKNKRREKDTHPEYSGKLNVEGREYWLSGWVREKDGEKFFSLSVKPKEPKPADVARGPAPKPIGDPTFDPDSDVPF